MGYDWKFTDDNFTCTAEARSKSAICGLVECLNGECVDQQCVCDPGWQNGKKPGFTPKHCDLCCTLPCVNEGVCHYIHSEDVRICNCLDISTTGAYCEELKPTTTPQMTIVHQPVLNHVTIAVICAVLGFLILLLVAATIILYFSYKRRHRWALKFVQEIYYKFQKPEDSDPRKHDVFISYRTSNEIDRKFVVQTLLPGLESMGFSTCIDERDFIPGCFIAESIKVAVQFSRRSLLVLSPAYIDGEWPQYEVECAIVESLNKQHRIVPVIFEPIDSYKGSISPHLIQILESITYIEWPTDGGENNKKAVDDFWRRIKLSMPKKKDMQHQEKETKQSKDIAIDKTQSLFKPHKPNGVGDIQLERSPGGFLMKAV